MRWQRAVMCINGLLLLAAACAQPHETQEVLPVAAEWKTSTPEAQGADSEQLAAVLRTIREQELKTHAIFVVRNGVAILDAKFYPYTLRDGPHDVASVTKSVTATLIGIAIDKGYIRGVDQKVFDFFPGRAVENRDANKDNMTVEDLLTMRSGFACGHHDERELWDMMFQTEKDWVQYILDLPMEGEPGVAYAYCSPNTHLLSAILSAATNMSELDFAREHLFGPLGIQDVLWPADPQGITRGWGDLYLRPSDMAKIGYLYLNDGDWRGKRVVSKEWIEQSLTPRTSSGEEEDYGYSWRFPKAFPGVYLALGRGSQYIINAPQQHAVIALTGGRSGDVDMFTPALAMALAAGESLPENPKGLEALRTETGKLAATPAAEPVPALPALASTISGKRYDLLESNYYGLECLKFSFDTADLTLDACFADRETGAVRRGQIPVGLDNLYRVFPDFVNGTPGGAKGYWASDDTFVAYLSAIQDYISLKLTISFAGDQIRVHMQEESGLLDETVTGIVSDAE